MPRVSPQTSESPLPSRFSRLRTLDKGGRRQQSCDITHSGESKCPAPIRGHAVVSLFPNRIRTHQTRWGLWGIFPLILTSLRILLTLEHQSKNLIDQTNTSEDQVTSMTPANRWQKEYATKLTSAADAARRVKNGDRLYVGSLCSEPRAILRALEESYVDDVEMVQFIRGPEAVRLASGEWGRFRIKTFFAGAGEGGSRAAAEYNYIPLFHSQIPGFFRNRRIPIDVAIIQVSEPDRFGRFSLGISVDFSSAAVESARMVIAQVNPLMPRTHGDTFIDRKSVV